CLHCSAHRLTSIERGNKLRVRSCDRLHRLERLQLELRQNLWIGEEKLSLVLVLPLDGLRERVDNKHALAREPLAPRFGIVKGLETTQLDEIRARRVAVADLILEVLEPDAEDIGVSDGFEIQSRECVERVRVGRKETGEGGHIGDDAARIRRLSPA